MFPLKAAALSPRSGSTVPGVLRSALHVVIVLVAFSAAGCSTQSVSERSAACATTDWYAYGVTDGRLGVPAGDRKDYFQDCLETGATIDVAAYTQGRAEGLLEYCTADRGYEVGRTGGRYHDVCQGQAEIAFLQGYERGREERPGVAVGPRIGIGLGVGSRRSWGGIGLGFPFFHGGHGYHRRGFPYFHDYCFYNSAYCRARGWY